MICNHVLSANVIVDYHQWHYFLPLKLSKTGSDDVNSPMLHQQILCQPLCHMVKHDYCRLNMITAGSSIVTVGKCQNMYKFYCLCKYVQAWYSGVFS